MSFHPNKSPVEVIKEGAFGGTYFRDIYSNVVKKWYKSSWKEFPELTPSIIHQVFMMLKLINME